MNTLSSGGGGGGSGGSSSSNSPGNNNNNSTSTAATAGTSSSGGGALAVFALPEARGGTEDALGAAKLHAARLAWPLLHGVGTWDAQRALLSACGFGPGGNSSGGSGGSLGFLDLAQAVGLVDGLVHRVPPHHQPPFSTAWDMAKLGIVAELPGPLAEVGAWWP